jgi:hypothetical protein
METNLRPMNLGEILDRTAQLYRQNFLLFAGIASVYAGAVLAIGLIQTALQEWARIAHMTRLALFGSGVALLIMVPLIFVLSGIAGAANNCAVAWVNLGEPATIRGAYRAVLPRFWRYIGIMLLKTFFAWSPTIGLYAGIVGVTIYFTAKGILTRAGAAQGHAPANTSAFLAYGAIVGLLGLALLPAFIYGIIMSLRYALAVPASVVENLKANGSLRRSVQLSQASRGRIFILWLLVGVIELGLIAVTQSFFLVLAFRHHGVMPAGWRVLQQVVSFFTTTFVAPIPAIGITLFYYDQRVRKEGYDIEWMMQAAGLTVPLPVPAQQQTSDATSWQAPPPAPVESQTAVEQTHAGTPEIATQILPAAEPGADAS